MSDNLILVIILCSTWLGWYIVKSITEVRKIKHGACPRARTNLDKD